MAQVWSWLVVAIGAAHVAINGGDSAWARTVAIGVLVPAIANYTLARWEARQSRR